MSDEDSVAKGDVLISNSAEDLDGRLTSLNHGHHHLFLIGLKVLHIVLAFLGKNTMLL